MPAVADTYAPGRGEGVERIVKRYVLSLHLVVVVTARVKDNAKWRKS